MYLSNKLKIKKDGSFHSMQGSQVVDLVNRSFELQQTSTEKQMGLVRVCLQVYVLENDIEVVGKFKASKYIKKQ